MVNETDVEDNEREKIADEQGQTTNLAAGIATRTTMEKPYKAEKVRRTLKAWRTNLRQKLIGEAADRRLSEESGEVEDESTEDSEVSKKVDKEVQDGVDEETDILSSTQDVLGKNLSLIHI